MSLQGKLYALLELNRKYDELVEEFIKELSYHQVSEYRTDATEHLRQVHYKLADCRGQFGAVRVAISKMPKE